MKKKHLKKVEDAIIKQVIHRMKNVWRHEHEEETAYLLCLDDCYAIIEKYIHPRLPGWDRYNELYNNRDWETLTEEEGLFVDNFPGEGDWDTFYQCHEKAVKRMTKALTSA